MAHSEMHREGARYAQLIEDVWKSLRKEETTENMEEVLNKAIRFYGSHVTKLPECNSAVFKLAEIFFKTSTEKLIEWNFRDANALLLLMVTMLLKRKDEATIRATAVIVRKLISRLSEAELSRSAEIHHKPTQLVFHKMSKVATYYTQFKLLEVLHVFLSGQDEFIASVFKKEKLVVESGSLLDATHFFESLEANNFVMTARDFLDSYNQTMCNPSFIHSTYGFIVGLEETKKIPASPVFFDFCLRNLSISFFVKASVLTGDQRLEEEIYFVELEDCDVTVDAKRFVNPNHVQLIVKSSRFQVLDKADEHPKNCRLTGIVKMIVGKEDDVVLGQIVPRFQSKSPMLFDNNTDIESLASFRTVNTVIRDARPVELPAVALPKIVELNTSSDSFTRAPKKKVPEKSEDHAAPKLRPQLSVQDIYKSQTSEPPKVIETVKRQQKLTQVAKVGPLTAQQARGEMYDTVQDDSDRLPPFRRFMSQARERRQASQTQQEPEPVEDVEIPGNRKAQTKKAAKKPAVKKTGPKSKKNTDYSSEEIETEVLEQFRDALNPSEPLAPAKKEPKRKTKTLIRSNADLNSSAEDREVMKTVVEARKRSTAKQSYFNKTKPKAAVVTKERKPATTKKTSKRQPVKAQKPRPDLEYSSDEFEVELIRKEAVVTKPPAKLITTSRYQMENEVVAYEVKVDSPKIMSKPKPAKVLEPVVKIQPPTVVKKEKLVPFNALRKQNNDLRPAAPASPPAQASFTRFQPENMPGSDIRRPFLDTGLTNMNEPCVKRSRPDGKENLPPAKKSRDDFDELLNAGRQVVKAPEKKETLEARRNKHVSFHGNVSLIPDGSPPAKRAKLPEIPVEVGPETGTPQIQYNTAMLGQNQLLNEFITGSQQHSSFEDENFDEVIMTTQTIQKKKLSPTIVRTVQYRRVNEIAEKPTLTRRVGNIARPTTVFLEKAHEEAEKTMESLRKLQASVQDPLKPATKASIIKAVDSVRSSNDRLKKHVAEHVKLLKRLHHSKRTMTQLFGENNDNVRAWREAAKQGMLEMRQQYDDRIHQVGLIHQNLIAKQETIKKDVWRQYIADITDQFNRTVQNHLDF